MARYQAYKGDPEQKLVVTMDDFSGGINLVDSDDLMNARDFRYGLNLDLDKVGDLDSRQGWGESGGLSDLLKLLQDSPGYPLLGYDPANQVNRGFTAHISENLSKFIDISYFNQNEEVTFGFEDKEITGNSVTGTAKLVIVDDLQAPTYIETVSEVVTFTYYRNNPKVKLVMKPTKGFTPTYDRGRQQLFAAVQVDKTNGLVVDGQLSDIYLVQGNIDQFKDTAKEMLLFKIVHNPNNLWERVIDAKSLYEIQRGYSSRVGDDYLQFILIYTDQNDKMYYFTASIRFNVNTIEKHKTMTGEFDTRFFNYNKSGHLYSNLMDITYGYDKDTLFFNGGASMEGSQGMVSIKFSNVGFEEFDMAVKYIGGPFSEAYKPSPLEVRRVGFNVLGASPLTWIDNQGIYTKAVQGVYLTTEDNIPINIIPMGKKFKVNVIYTGTFSNDFEIKFHEFRNEEKIEITADVSRVASTEGLHSYLITFTTQPNEEVELEIGSSESSTMGKYRDYYPMGQVHPEAKQVKSLKIAEHAIAQVWDRYVYFKGDTLWYSDVGRYDYVPNLNYITLPLSRSDEITHITFFRNNYIIMTKERIYKMRGHFESPDLTIDLVNDTVGCIAPSSVQMVDNQLYFLTNQGIYALKAETFRQDLENVDKKDSKLGEIIPKASHLYSYSDDKQYVLMFNENYTREKIGEFANKTEIHNREFKKPDVVRYYYEDESFVFDVYEEMFYPRFVTNQSGRILGWFKDRFYVRGNDHRDFGHPFHMYLETAASTYGYPSHEKKYKQLVMKLGRESDKLDVDIGMYVDGKELHDDVKWASHEVDEVDHENSRFMIKRMRIPSLKGKNLAITLNTKVNHPVSLKTLSFTFKLGKMRE